MQDASLNAIVKLDCFATMTSTIITAQALAGVERIFQPYLDGPADGSCRPAVIVVLRRVKINFATI